MIAPHTAAINRLTTAAGLGLVQELAPLVGGKNNRVFRVTAENGMAVLKSYFRHPDDTRDRLGNEWAFSQLCGSLGICCIPRPLGCDSDAGLALFEFVIGRAPTPADVTDERIDQALEFIGELNNSRWKPLAGKLPIASEACFSLAEHLATVARRIERLTTVSHPEAHEFVKRELQPEWARVHQSVEKLAYDNGLSLSKLLEPTDRCVSPSDFGFHNAILGCDSRTCFIDFEYAGWDDPAKMICDFFCQPTVPVPFVHFGRFCHEVAQWFPNPSIVISRAQVLLPVYQVKWVCIRLNEFLTASAQRRDFALTATERDMRQSVQLAAARAALAAIHDLEEIAK